MRSHVCKEADYCKCYKLATEPDPDCPIHGYPYPPRCAECGRFMKPEPVKMCDTCGVHVWFDAKREGCLLSADGGGPLYDIPPERTCEFWKPPERTVDPEWHKLGKKSREKWAKENR